MVRTLIRKLRQRQGFEVLEILIVTVIASTIMTVAVPTFEQSQEKALDHDARSSLYSAHEIAKALFTGDYDQSYPNTAQVVLDMSEAEPDGFTFRAAQAGVSVSTGPHDISLKVDGPYTITVCSRSDTTRTFCERFVDGGPPLASGVAGFGGGAVAMSTGLGPLGEPDATAALPTETTPPTVNAGPTNSGQPVDPENGHEFSTTPPTTTVLDTTTTTADTTTASDTTTTSETQTTTTNDTTEIPAPSAPAVSFTVTPPTTTPETGGHFEWSNNGGVISTQTCVLDGQSYSCPLSSTDVSGLPPGTHTVEIDSQGPGGSDSQLYTWTITSPPNDRLILKDKGDYAISETTVQPTGAFEVGAWVNLYSAPDGGDATIASQGCTWSNGSQCRTADAGWSLAITNDYKVHFIVHTGGNGAKAWVSDTWGKANDAGCQIDPNATIGLHQWHYVSASFDPSGRVTTWVDGKIQGCSAPLNGLTPALTPDQSLLMGAQPNPAGNLPTSAYLQGAIGELRMTMGGAYANVVDPGPSDHPGMLASPAENGRPATFLFHYSDWSDSMANVANAAPQGNAHLSWHDEY